LALSCGLEHVFEAFCECADTGLLRAFMVSRVAVENVVKGLRLIAELDDKIREYSTGILLPDILKIEKKGWKCMLTQH